MTLNRVLAGIAVRDVDQATPFYEALFARPADARPMDGLAEWHVPSSGVVQLVENREGAGRSILRIPHQRGKIAPFGRDFRLPPARKHWHRSWHRAYNEMARTPASNPS